MASRADIGKSNWGKIVEGSGGCFLDPPTYPTHHHHIEGVWGGFFMGLTAIADEDWLDDECRAEAKALLAGWERPPITDPAIKDWIRQVLGYFRGCFQGVDSEGLPSWKAGELLHGKRRCPECGSIVEVDPADYVKYACQHAGVHLIRKFYPEYIPTKADFQSAYWGKPRGAATKAEEVYYIEG